VRSVVRLILLFGGLIASSLRERLAQRAAERQHPENSGHNGRREKDDN
jgi:hypothetical protein